MEIYELAGKYVELISQGKEEEARALVRGSKDIATILKNCRTAADIASEEIQRGIDSLKKKLDQDKAATTPEGVVAMYEAQPPVVPSHSVYRVITG
jgi:hypothetical protein